MYPWQLCLCLHKKVPALFIKLDISKAFNTVNWPFLLSIMTHLGFGQRWRDWISSLWCTGSSSFLVNGEPGRRILHCKGVRQGDPLSPMLFILAMEPLHRLFYRAQQMGLLTKIQRNYETFRVSLYVDDATVFISPSQHDLTVTDYILHLFAQASRLLINRGKIQIFPIQCDNIDTGFNVQTERSLSSFPCTYLGLPLHTRKPTRNML